MSRLQLLHHKISLKKRFLKLKRISLSNFAYTVLGLTFITVLIVNNAFFKDQYYQLGIFCSKHLIRTMAFFNKTGDYGLRNKSQLDNTIQVQKLTETNQYLTNQITELMNENKRLRQATHYIDYSVDKFITTAVVNIDSTQGKHYLLAQCGSKVGITVGQPVLYRNAIVGIVDTVTQYACRISLLNNDMSRIPAYINVQEQQGMVRGVNHALLQFDYKNNTFPCAINDPVFSSGLGGIYPPHKLIGRVANLRGQCIYIKPIIDYLKIDTVSILLTVNLRDVSNLKYN